MQRITCKSAFGFLSNSKLGLTTGNSSSEGIVFFGSFRFWKLVPLVLQHSKFYVCCVFWEKCAYPHFNISTNDGNFPPHMFWNLPLERWCGSNELAIGFAIFLNMFLFNQSLLSTNKIWFHICLNLRASIQHIFEK